MEREHQERLDNLQKLVESIASTVEVGTRHKKSDRIFDIAAKFSVPAVLGTLAWVWSIEGKLAEVNAELDVFEAVALTQDDGFEIYKAIDDSAASGEKLLHDLLVAVTALQQSISDIRERIDRLDTGR